MTVEIKQKETFDIIQATVNKGVDLIKPTYGPASNKVIISKVTHRMVVDDGVQIARDTEFPDAAENAVWKVVREVAITTNDRVGDGTTSSLIMVQAILKEAAKLPSFRGRDLEVELKAGLEDAKKQMLKLAIPVTTKDQLLKVARISFDDQKIAEVIASTWHKVGPDGIVTVDRSGTTETFAVLSEGIKISRGYISPYMVSNQQRQEAIIEKPYILLTDYRLTETNDVLPIMNKMAEKNIVNLVLICDNLESSALATAIVNKIQGKFNLVAINIPGGVDKTQWLEDVALLTGAKVFSEKKGDRLENANITDLGRAARFICHEKESLITAPKGAKAKIQSTIADLRTALITSTDEKQKDALEKRLAFLTNTIAVVKVGAATANEENALKYKVEDAVNAVRVAYRSGVVCGAGLTLYRLKTSSPLLNEALKAPYRQLMLNMEIRNLPDLKPGEAMNVVTGEIGPYMKVGVIDPVEVLIAGVESAISIGSILLTSHGIIVETPKEIPNQQQ